MEAKGLIVGSKQKQAKKHPQLLGFKRHKSGVAGDGADAGGSVRPGSRHGGSTTSAAWLRCATVAAMRTWHRLPSLLTASTTALTCAMDSLLYPPNCDRGRSLVDLGIAMGGEVNLLGRTGLAKTNEDKSGLTWTMHHRFRPRGSRLLETPPNLHNLLPRRPIPPSGHLFSPAST